MLPKQLTMVDIFEGATMLNHMEDWYQLWEEQIFLEDSFMESLNFFSGLYETISEESLSAAPAEQWIPVASPALFETLPTNVAVAGVTQPNNRYWSRQTLAHLQVNIDTSRSATKANASIMQRIPTHSRYKTRVACKKSQSTEIRV